MVFPFHRTAENQVEPERVNTQAAASEFAPEEREICSTSLFSLTVAFKFQEMYPNGYFQLIKHIIIIVKSCWC